MGANISSSNPNKANKGTTQADGVSSSSLQALSQRHVANRSKNPHVVIVGGGVAGRTAARALNEAGGFAVTLIDRRDEMMHKVGGLRAATNPGWETAAFIPYTEIFKADRDGGQFVHGTVSNVDMEREVVTLECGRELRYDYLILATGAVNAAIEGNAAWRTAAEGRERMQKMQAAIASSENIVIVGGGAVGIELAGELADLNELASTPSRRVTLVHSRSALLSSAQPPLSDKMKAKVLTKLRNRGIDVVLGERVEGFREMNFDGKSYTRPADNSVATSAGRLIECDLLFDCAGSRVDGELFRSWDADKRESETGRLRVNAHMQLEGKNNVFAIGDIANTQESKMAFFAGQHAEVAVHNIRRIERLRVARRDHSAARADKLTRKLRLREYHPVTSAVMFVPVGRRHGAAQLPFGVFGSRVTRTIKGDLFTKQTWGGGNLTAPKGLK